ncbi:MAG: hydroxymethylglutaryl-CoA lyase [Bacteroidia bacterium]|nr:MAG: hydroxymethylglutaryl-CoA lyase [Bacteroidia bacterium]
MKSKIIECPRDAMQGIQQWIPTELKIQYLQTLLQAGFDTLDCVSFVSPKAIPQMKDATEVIENLNITQTSTKLLAIIANIKGAEQAANYAHKIHYQGFPFSISEQFQLRNTHKTIDQSFVQLKEIQNIVKNAGQTLVVYLSMAFGNPYGEEWNLEILKKWADKMAHIGIEILALSDTIGSANPEDVYAIFSQLIPLYPTIEFGAHFHALPNDWYPKIDAAYQAGCRRFDGAWKGYGGCPMAKNDLTGNIPTENIIQYLNQKENYPNIPQDLLNQIYQLNQKIFQS